MKYESSYKSQTVFNTQFNMNQAVFPGVANMNQAINHRQYLIHWYISNNYDFIIEKNGSYLEFRRENFLVHLEIANIHTLTLHAWALIAIPQKISFKIYPFLQFREINDLIMLNTCLKSKGRHGPGRGLNTWPPDNKYIALPTELPDPCLCNNSCMLYQQLIRCTRCRS